MPALSRSDATAQAAKVCHRCAETYYRACGSMVAGVRPLVTVECPGSAWIVRCRTLIGSSRHHALVRGGRQRTRGRVARSFTGVMGSRVRAGRRCAVAESLERPRAGPASHDLQALLVRLRTRHDHARLRGAETYRWPLRDRAGRRLRCTSTPRGCREAEALSSARRLRRSGRNGSAGRRDHRADRFSAPRRHSLGGCSWRCRSAGRR
jgi:hypothetical protein